MPTPLADPTNPTLEELILMAIRRALVELRTGLPAKVLTFDITTGYADVQPLLLRMFIDPATETATLSTPPPIVRVPVIFPTFGPWTIASQLEPDETVWLSVADRSLDRWKDAPAGQLVDPKDARRHTLSDVVATPGLHGRSYPVPGLGPNLRIAHRDGVALVELGADGAVRVEAERAVHVAAPAVFLDAGGDADQSFVRGDALSEWLTTQLSVATAFGPSGPAVSGLTAAELSSALKGR